MTLEPGMFLIFEFVRLVSVCEVYPYPKEDPICQDTNNVVFQDESMDVVVVEDFGDDMVLISAGLLGYRVVHKSQLRPLPEWPEPEEVRIIRDDREGWG